MLVKSKELVGIILYFEIGFCANQINEWIFLVQHWVQFTKIKHISWIVDGILSFRRNWNASVFGDDTNWKEQISGLILYCRWMHAYRRNEYIFTVSSKMNIIKKFLKEKTIFYWESYISYFYIFFRCLLKFWNALTCSCFVRLVAQKDGDTCFYACTLYRSQHYQKIIQIVPAFHRNVHFSWCQSTIFNVESPTAWSAYKCERWLWCG